MPTQLTIGPFTWTRDDDRKEENWRLENAVDLIGCIWSCTNYGKPRFVGSAFSGWRCGSGGPWPERYTSREDAMTRVIPYLMTRMRDRVAEARRTLKRREAALASCEKLLAA